MEKLPNSVENPSHSPSEGSITIGAGVQFKGEVTVPGLASVNGKFEGALVAKDLIVGDAGCVSGNISVETAEVRGKITDNLTVQSKLTLRASGSITGSVSYSKITIEEGGLLSGKIEHLQPAAATQGEANVVMLQQPAE